jgi:hypothetical protein
LRRPKNWRIDCRLQRAQGESPEITQNLLANSGLEGDATPTCEILEPSESIVCRKRNSISRKPDGNDGKVRTPRQLKPIDQNIKLVADSTLNTHFEVTKPVTKGQHKVSKMSYNTAQASRLQEEKVGDGERGSSRRSMEKENKPFGCAPAGMFLRSLSRGKDRPTTRCNSGTKNSHCDCCLLMPYVSVRVCNNLLNLIQIQELFFDVQLNKILNVNYFATWTLVLTL